MFKIYIEADILSMGKFPILGFKIPHFVKKDGRMLKK